MPLSLYIRAMHPKTEIRPDPATIKKVLASGWVGQLKIHGHRAQIHLSASEDDEMVAYNRQGKPHRKLLPPPIVKELRRLFAPTRGWTAIDAEWIKPKNKLYVFDVLKQDGKVLRDLTYGERWELLPTAYLSPHISTLPLYRTVDKCMEAMAKHEDYIEGLVFKSLTAQGFADTSIVRCRKKVSRP